MIGISRKWINSTILRTLDLSLGSNRTDRIRAKSWEKRLASNQNSDPELKLVRKLLSHGQVAIDVGAYGAYYTVAMSQSVGLNGRVVAFEPHPRYANVLANLLEHKKISNVSVEQIALLDAARVAHLAVSTSAGDQLAGEVHITSSESSDFHVTEVEVDTLDAVMSSRYTDLDPSLIKIDIEGSELAMINGALVTLKKHRPVIVCEVEERHCNRYGHTSRDVFDLLNSIDYHAYVYDERSNKLVGDRSGSINFVFVHKDDKARIQQHLNG